MPCGMTLTKGTLLDDVLVTFAIPCYNSAAYIDRCVESILSCGADDIEVVIVDDGSTDDTLEVARGWEKKSGGIVRAVHQDNAGHGGAVMRGIAEARGRYFKVVDSDDWLDDAANTAMLAKLRELASSSPSPQDAATSPQTSPTPQASPTPQTSTSPREAPLDLMVVNYAYEHITDGKREVMHYRGMLPTGRVFSWDEMGRIPLSKYILMHSVVYRTQLLRECGLDLPRHTFYVDNIFAYVPLPACERVFYLDVDLYHYLIGRDDQSVNESVMAGRIDQQLRITRVMISAFPDLQNIDAPAKLRRYMTNYLTMMMVICTVFSLLSGRDDAQELRRGIWQFLRERDPETHRVIRRGILGVGTHLPGCLGDKTLIALYHIAQRIFKFN